ncbi:hypothetical protein [Pseudanabaena sp. PCC 6802]|uniref:hypothetical protein n=1 Tax=Pseudanabaena sp. PCC 6802 TaxID=118173 RepID=UPI000346B6F0|nr:hypothetical protein [Pseudanabaena sp. PCC 6802]
MAKTKKVQLGGLPPRYNFLLNPYPNERLWRCPHCEKKSGQRKLPLLIHVKPSNLIALNYTCRYCKDCDLLIGHKTEIEHLLTEIFRQRDPEAIGNDYLIVGTVEKSTWREGLNHHQNIADMLSHMSDFVEYEGELRMTRGGYYPIDVEPPVMEPPPSEEWVKSNNISSRDRLSWTKKGFG